MLTARAGPRKRGRPALFVPPVGAPTLPHVEGGKGRTQWYSACVLIQGTGQVREIGLAVPNEGHSRGFYGPTVLISGPGCPFFRTADFLRRGGRCPPHEGLRRRLAGHVAWGTGEAPFRGVRDLSAEPARRDTLNEAELDQPLKGLRRGVLGYPAGLATARTPRPMWPLLSPKYRLSIST